MLRGWHGNGEEGLDTGDIPKWKKKRLVIITDQGGRTRDNFRFSKPNVSTVSRS